jgi:hypothetical protein
LEVYVRPFPEVEEEWWPISTGGGQWPMWNPAGNELFYRGPTGLMARAFETEPTFTPGALTQLFERDGPLGNNQRMAARSRVIVVQNWLEELRRLVPTD